MINEFFDQIMIGNPFAINEENIRLLNNRALEIYNIPELSNTEVEDLKKIIMIANVLYNRTDMSILPIEDGFYDLLLEKYKKYDSKFQVGSAIVDFRNFIENDIDNPIKVAKQVISFVKHEEKDELHQDIFNKINIDNRKFIDSRDFYKNVVSFDNEYITKREHNTEHNHPDLVGTLDKCKFVLNQDAINAGVFNDANVKVLERDFFQKHIEEGIINPNKEYTIICELKYDGVSVEADCGLEVISARTRGDTGIGVASDISSLLKGYTFKHANCMIGEDPLGVKFEAIMTKSNLAKFNKLRGRSYVNCRTAIIGLFGASDGYLYRDLITLIPLSVDRNQIHLDNRIQEIELLNKVFITNGEPLRYCVFTGTINELLFFIKAFLDEAKYSKDYIDFMYDGIVVTYLDESIREKLGRKNSINKYQMAVKFDPLEKQTIFRGYTYEVGQHGTVTPMIHYDPIEFLGTIHTKSSGSSYSRFKELDLKLGDYISVRYVNDVMPYVSRVECRHNRENTNPVIEFPTKCPVCGSNLVFSDSGKSAMCSNINCKARNISRMVNMFDKLNIKGFAQATFEAIPEIDHLYKFYSDNIPDLKERLGVADSNKLINELSNLLSGDTYDYIWMGSLGFTGIARKKWQQILLNITVSELNNMYTESNSDPLLFRLALNKRLPGIGEITLNVIANEWGFFKDDIELLLSKNMMKDSIGCSDAKMQIRFTGCRNQQLVEQLNIKGYDIDGNSSVTKKTDILLIPYEGFTSTKVEKAKSNPNIKIIPIDEFINNMNKYIKD